MLQAKRKASLEKSIRDHKARRKALVAGGLTKEASRAARIKRLLAARKSGAAPR
jgi:hypothetical protein